MTTVFIAGSISIIRLHEKVQERITKVVTSGLDVVVGDADGADTSIQKCLYNCQAERVTVYCTGEHPRNNVADWPIRRVESKAKPGSRAYYTAKDLEMARDSDYGLMVWDCKSTGTLSNIIALLTEKKKTVVFINKIKDFITVSDKDGIDQLLSLMTAHARSKAEEKIGLTSKIARIAQEKFDLPAPGQFSETGATRAPNQAVAVNNKLRLELMTALTEHIRRADLSTLEAANLFGVTQPLISDLTKGKADSFGLDSLVNMAASAGLRVEMHVRQST